MSFTKSKPNPHQKLVYSKESGLNSTGDMSVIGLFKSTSSLAQSIRRQKYDKNNEDQFGGYMGYNQNNILNASQQMSMTNRSEKNQDASRKSFSSSARLIMNNPSSTANLSTYKPHEESKLNTGSFIYDKHMSGSFTSSSTKPTVRHGMNPLSEVRNLTHFYDKVQSDQTSYELISQLMAEKRMDHLDTLDEYEVWKKNYLSTIDDRIKRKIDSLKDHLDRTKHEINSQFNKPNEELLTLLWSDINKIELIYNQITLKRNDEIQNIKNQITEQDSECMKTVENTIINLQKKLIEIGFKLDYECEEISKEKFAEKNEYFRRKEEMYEHLFLNITEGEKLLVEESKINLKNFILRWKNVKLNKYVQNLKNKLLSDKFIDNQERYEIINLIKQDQMKIYHDRVSLIVNEMFDLPIEEISTKRVELINKRLEEIYNYAQNIYDNHTQKLVENSDKIYQLSLKQIEKFKSRVKTLYYEFGEDKDNYNNNLFNQYENLTCLDDLIELEFSPIINNSKNERKDYVSKIIQYLDDYDDYVHNNCVKLLNIITLIATKNDEHKKSIQDSERNYQLDIAKAADNDEDIIFQKEEILKTIINHMKESIDKESLDKSLEDAFKVMDELEVEYREFFNIIDNVFNSHEGRLVNTFHTYEIKILAIFGILGKERLEEIRERRNKESEFLSKKKEAELLYEEEKALEEEKNNPAAKKGAAPKKKPAPSNPKGGKKGEVKENLIPQRAISEFKSKLNFDYLIDFTIKELVQSNLRNVIYSREDDIFGLNAKTEGTGSPQTADNSGNQTNTVLQTPNNAENNKKLQVPGQGGQNRPQSKTKPNPSPGATSTDPEDFHTILNLFNPYTAVTNKIFTSPLSLKNFKLLSEENTFTEDFLTEILQKLYNSLCDKIFNDLNSLISSAKTSDNELREEYLSELDIRLKSLAPRKGKVEVEEYDKRMNEIELHNEKFNLHFKSIMERNSKDGEENKKLLDELTKDYEEFNALFESINKGMEEEQTMKGLDDKQKRFKTSFYDLSSKISEIEIKLHIFSKTNPENLINVNKNFILSLKTFKEKGTYSDNEVEFYKNKIENLNHDTITKEMNERELENKNKISTIKQNLTQLLEKIDKRYAITVENIMAKDVIGKKFGGPKRIANDVVINMKMKCNQAQEGLEKLLHGLKNLIIEFENEKNKSIISYNQINKNVISDSKFDKFEYFLKNSLPLEIRSQILSINNCVFSYGKYIEAFKPTLSTTYSLLRVSLKENSDNIEIFNCPKDEIEEDEKRKHNELLNLGYLSKFIIEGSGSNSAPSKDKKNVNESGPNFIHELNSIEEKVKVECAKIYTGEFAKVINNPMKIPETLIPFLQNVKVEMENFRLKCVRDLRTYVRKNK
jgi:golgin subfamily A member 4